jgi:uncharacterized membrane protein
MRKWVPLLIVATAFIASAAVYPNLPARIPTHWDMAGQVNGWSSRTWGAWMIPVIMIVLWAMLRWLPTIDPRGSNYAKFGGAFEGIIVSVMLFMLGVHVIALRAALGLPVAVERVMPLGVGVLLIVIGNLLPRARSNWFVGIRTPWTLSSDRVWEKTHRFGGHLLVAGGIIIVAAALLAGKWAHPVLIATVVACSLAVVIYSYVEWRREKAAPAAPAE